MTRSMACQGSGVVSLLQVSMDNFAELEEAFGSIKWEVSLM